jgi:hypothetical protein
MLVKDQNAVRRVGISGRLPNTLASRRVLALDRRLMP